MYHKFNNVILRKYDVRGVYGKDLFDEDAYFFGLTFAKYVLEHQIEGLKTSVVIGCDGRVSSPALKKELINGLIEGGIDVFDIGVAHTPKIEFTAKHLKMVASVAVTASHNPKEYNGFKFDFNGKAFFDENILLLGKMAENCEKATKQGEYKEINIDDEYLKCLLEGFNIDKNLRVCFDCGNGATGQILPKIVQKIGLKAKILFPEIDGNFPNHHPDPSVESNNADLKKKVLETGSDLGIGIDGDGDRVGVIDEKGNMIFIDFFAIIIWRDIMSKVENKHALFDVKCSKSLADEIEKLGGVPVCYRTGNSYMKAKMREGDFAFGSELSGHVFFRDKWDNIDDGLYAGLRLVEILSKTDKTVSGLLEGVTRYYSSPEIIIKSTDEEKFKVIDSVKEYCKEKGYNVNDIDGVRAEFSNGWALVRASNTGPNITCRFEGVTEEDKDNIEKEFMALIK